MVIDGDSEGISIDMSLEEAAELGLILYRIGEGRRGDVGHEIVGYLKRKGFTFDRAGADGPRVGKPPSKWKEEQE